MKEMETVEHTEMTAADFRRRAVELLDAMQSPGRVGSFRHENRDVVAEAAVWAELAKSAAMEESGGSSRAHA